MSELEPEKLSVKDKARRFSVSEEVSVRADIPATTERKDAMDIAKKQKEAELSLLEEDYAVIQAELSKPKPDKEKIEILQISLSNQLSRFSKTQQKYQELLIKAGNNDEFQKEKAEERNLNRMKVEVDVKCSKLLDVRHSSTSSGGSGVSPEPYRPNLPKRELVKFDGDVRKWLAFWASFREIHNDASVPEIERFNYLIQSMVVGSSAHQHVTSFHLSAENYPKAVESLRERYGRTNMLIKVYVRDLLSLVIENSTDKSSDFSTMVTKLTHQLRNLESLGVTTDKCAQLLYPVVESAIPDDVLQAWMRHTNYKEDLDELLLFLQNEVNNKMERALAQSQFGQNKKSEAKDNDAGSKQKKKDSNPIATAKTLLTTPRGPGSVDKCVFCEGAHDAFACGKAMDFTLKEREDIIKKKGHCLKCLRKGHLAAKCRTPVKCLLCKKDHHVVMCMRLLPWPDENKERDPINSGQGSSGGSSGGSSTTAPTAGEFGTAVSSRGAPKVLSLANQVQTPNVPLQILPVVAYGTNGKRIHVRAVVDPGSQRSYVTSLLANELALPTKGQETIINDLFGGKRTEETVTPIKKMMISAINGDNLTTFNASTVDMILRSTDPTVAGTWNIDFKNKGIVFEDCQSTSTNINILIGNDIAAKIYTGRIEHLSYGPSAMETRFGWVLCGKLPNTSKTAGSLLISTLTTEDRIISDLWELSSIGILDASEKESRKELEENARQHFNKTIRINEEGRYEVDLPFLEGTKATLPSNFNCAERRLKSATRSIQKSGYLERYDAVFKQWEQDGMIEEVPLLQHESTHYLPHKAVIKSSSATTPIRPVFDASAKTKGHRSLNDCLEKGPNLLEMIPAILTRFRMYEVGMVADIKKAFQQISVAPKHRDYLRFLWWEDETCQRLKCYRHTRVVFGVSSSPFLLGATLLHHLEQAPDDLRDVAAVLKQNMYVDNLVASTTSSQDAIQFEESARRLLGPAQFDLRGWELGPSDEPKAIPVLGLIWETKEDTLRIDLCSAVDKVKEETLVTQRRVLSVCHSLFDPVGMLAPFIVVGKQILRECHSLKLGWDKELPVEIRDQFRKWSFQIPNLSDMRVRRHVQYCRHSSTLHVFCDASLTAAAAAVFLRVEKQEEVYVQLLMCKSRLVPAKGTIPRFELIACVIGARLASSVKEYLQDPDIPVTFWTDASTALAWIKGSSSWGTFVQNRVNEVRTLTKIEDWFHIPGKQNPADLPSRGCSAKKLVDLRWWEGPTWLTLREDNWPVTREVHLDLEEIDAERKKTVVSTLTKKNNFLTQLTVIPSYTRIIRVVGLCLKFIRNLRQQVAEKNGNEAGINIAHSLITQSGINMKEAEERLLILIQNDHEEELLKNRKLSPFRDENGVLRVRSRLTHEDDGDFISPILLPDDHILVRMLILEEHERCSHAGTQFVLASIRARFWIVNGRKTVRKVIRNCANCRRFLAEKVEVPEAPLPKIRTGESVPFGVTGVDMAGPLRLKDGRKIWIVLYTCATYRAIHLELTDTLSTDGFLKTLRRFVSRRGRPHTILSDNGLNFTGASRFMRRINWHKVEEYASVERINWQFNPPSAPWWGGFWERLIGLVKRMLRRILGNQVVGYEELVTLVVEVEEVMNNRPLTTLSEDPDDLTALTPNMFVRNVGLRYIPEVDVRDATHARMAMRKVQKLREELRSRFRLEYLGFLRQKGTSGKEETLKEGDVVLVENELLKRLDWPLGIVVEAIPGKDDKTRTYRVKTKAGILVRPAQRLYLVEIGQE